MAQRLFHRDNARILCVEIEQALIVLGLQPVADRFAINHRAEVGLASIDGGRANAAAPRAAGDEQRVDPCASSRDTKSVPKNHEPYFFTSSSESPR